MAGAGVSEGAQEGAGEATIPLGAFDLLAPIGAGGMGVVWRARSRSQGIAAAIKVIGEAWSEHPSSRAAFRREVRAIAGLSHPGIVAVYDLGQVDASAAAAAGGRLTAGAPYLAMEYLPHGNLERIAAILDWPALRQLLRGLLAALAHAHAHGVIHCDVKPANVLLSEETGGEVAIKVTDFGVAHALVGRLADDPQGGPISAGTPAYMPPEQLCGRTRDFGPWTDLYALGCMTWELCCGRLPFVGASLPEICEGHLYRPPPPFEPTIAVPDGLEGWLRRLLAKSIGERFAFAADAAHALKALERGRPSEPPVLWDSLRRRLPGAEVCNPDGATAVVPERRFSTVDLASATTMASDRIPTGERERAAAGAGAGGSQRRRPAPRLPWPASWVRPGDDESSLLLGGAGLGLFGLRAIPVIDRRDERDLLWNSLASVHALGRARVVSVRGASGVGKSRLCEWLAVRAHELGVADVLRASHGPIGGPDDGLGAMLARTLRAQGLAGDALYDHLLGQVERSDGERPPEWIRGRVAALAELVAPGAAPEEGVWPRVCFADDRERHAALTDALTSLARARPLLLWIDDAMWGPGSLAWVRHLVKGGADLPALIVVTVREECLGDQPLAARLLAAIEAMPGAVDRLDVRPLAEADHRRLIGRLLGFESALAVEIAGRTLGNPMFAVQLIGDWVERGLLVPTPAGFRLREGAGAALPDDLHQLWTTRVDRVLEEALGGEAEAALRALEVAACLGPQVDRDEWRAACAVLGLHADERWLDLLFAHRLAVATASGLRFVHGMLRESLERRADEAGRRRDHHRACAAMLEARYGDRLLLYASRLARHREAAGEAEAAVDPLLDACYRLQLTGAYEQAEELLGDLERLFGVLGLAASDPRRLRAAMQGVWLGWMRRSSDAAARAPVLRDLEADARRLEVRDVLGDLLRFRGLERRFAGDVVGSLDPLEEALAICEGAGDREGAARSSLALAVSLRALGRLGDAEGPPRPGERDRRGRADDRAPPPLLRQPRRARPRAGRRRRRPGGLRARPRGRRAGRRSQGAGLRPRRPRRPRGLRAPPRRRDHLLPPGGVDLRRPRLPLRRRRPPPPRGGVAPPRPLRRRPPDLRRAPRRARGR
ncbi:MAG: protein kinase [Nannocystaceae bacterium]